MRFLGAFLMSVAALALAHSGFVWIVNPRGEFEPNFLRPIVRDTRTVKVRLYQQFLKSGAVDGVVLGSSRSTQLAPSALQAVSGGRFFNFAVERARSEDYLAIYRWIRQQGVMPRLVVVGIDPEVLQEDENYLLDQNPVLKASLGRPQTDSPSRFPGSNVRPIVNKYKQVFTTSYFDDAIRSVWTSTRSRTGPPEFAVDPDGYVRAPRLEGERAAGKFDLKSEIQACLPRYVAVYRGIPELSSRRKGYFTALVEEAGADHVSLIVWITPNHPLAVRYVERSTDYKKVFDELREYVGRLHTSFGIAAYDYSDPAAFGATPDGWWDCAHLDESNLTRVAQRLLRPMTSGSRPPGLD